MSDKDFVNFNQAMKLAELGFDYKAFLYYQISDRDLLDNGVRKDFNWRIRNKVRYSAISAPTLSQVCKWLRENHNIHIQIESVIGKRWTYDVVDINPTQDVSGEYISRIERNGYPVIDTYEQALSAGIDVAIGMLENKNEQQ